MNQASHAELLTEPRAAAAMLAERVLLIEDAEDDVLLFRRLLGRTQQNLGLDIVTEGETAVGWLTEKLAECDSGRRVLPRAIFVDLHLPGMSGLEVLRWIRSQRLLDAVMVFVCTSSAAPCHAAEAEHLGADAFVLKHPSPERLARLLAVHQRRDVPRELAGFAGI